MKSKQLGVSLNAYARLLHHAGCTQGSRDLEALAAVFDVGGEQTVATIVRKIGNGWSRAGRRPEHPASLRMLLELVASASKTTGTAAVAKDFEAVLSLFVGPGHATAREFADAAIRTLEAAHAPVQPPPLDQALIRAYVERLISASSDNASFDKIIEELRRPRAFSNATLAAIANGYLETERAFKSKSEILKAITSHQLQAALQDSRDRRMERLPA